MAENPNYLLEAQMNSLVTSVACWVAVDVDEVLETACLHCWVQVVRCWLEQDWKRTEVLKGSVMIANICFEMDQTKETI